GAQQPREFLSGLDFFVYYHDPRWVEAFGRTILEALASGVVAVLPPHFEVLFGDAALYAEPRDVRMVVEQMRADRTAYDHQVQVASVVSQWLPGRTPYDHQVLDAEKVSRTRYDHEAHIARVTELIGPPTTRPSTTDPSSTPPTTPSATATTSASPPSTTANDRP